MKPHKYKHKKRRDEKTFDGYAFMKEIEAQLPEEVFMMSHPPQYVQELIAVGEAAFTFIRQSNIDYKTRKAFQQLGKQFRFYSDKLQGPGLPF